ncbi:GRAS domain-containing protein [Cephalotus follicularis]|uniref:GRAS domain-containing protein n=1 Tax=Cephalotus follicularis TaxID=3775 RepID=A0A1Q3CDF2_CEPFO|nr:GRAS domain-containing protein [Cephalotus follicularis]
MIMDSGFGGLADSVNGSYIYDHETILPISSQYPNYSRGLNFNYPSLDCSFMNSPLESNDLEPGNSSRSLGGSTEGDSYSPSDDSDFSETVKYISQMLMEEDMDEKPCMFHDTLALQAAERSFSMVLGEKVTPSPDQPLSFSDGNDWSPDDCFSGFGGYSSNSSSVSGTSDSNLADYHWNGEFGESKPFLLQTPIPPDFVFQSTSKFGSPIEPSNGFASNGNGVVGSSVSQILDANLFSESELALQFKRGVEEASKFLPKGNPLIINLENNSSASFLRENAPKVAIKSEIDENEREYLLFGLREKKNHERGYEDLEEERKNKQSAVYVDESELSELFDRVLLCSGDERYHPGCIYESMNNGEIKNLQQNGQTNGSSGGKSHGKKRNNKEEVVDLRTLLILCAQAVSFDDRRTANEQLKKIRQHSSPFGYGAQRLAHYFANALEARLAGTGTQIYTALSSKQSLAADVLKAYQTYISVCSFSKVAIIFANHNILRLSEKETTLHIVDFGILYGFQWPELIKRLSKRPAGPPKLRITGIELPQRGFRPSERVQETGRRLAKYCERFKVPFEYNAIAKKWENIRIEELKINDNEFLAVNCLFRFRNLLDETVVVNSPRSTTLNLIRKMKPNIFVHSLVNGSYNAPFFVTRFREALFHFSALFDICESTLTREDPHRLMIEKDFFGREIMNVVACEGSERIERAETYKQWQVRNTRAGLKQLPLNPELVKKLRGKVKCGYHNDFVVNEDGNWMLQGWKGRILFASSAWSPA